MAGDSAHDRIRLRAYQLYVARGEHPGRAEEDWLEAEREILADLAPLISDEKQRFSSAEEPAGGAGNGHGDRTGQPRRARKDTPRRARG